MLRIATFNVNGIRASVRRGFDRWLSARDCDVVCIQETRCPPDQVPEAAYAGYHLSHHHGSLAGRNGVAVLSRQPPDAVREGFGSREFDHEGRYIEVDLPGLTVGNVYLPKGATPTDGPEAEAKFARKLRFTRSFGRYLTRARRTALAQGREFAVMGDWNVAHAELDVKNWRANRRHSGFLPEERAWIASVQTPRTLVDVVRALHPDTPGPYSWWTWRGRAWAEDTGWRIDYQLVTPRLAKAAIRGGTDRDATAVERMSDHSPVVVDYAW